MVDKKILGLARRLEQSPLPRVKPETERLVRARIEEGMQLNAPAPQPGPALKGRKSD